MLAEIEIFGQLLDWPDLLVVGLLVILEGLLSIDNALVLGLLAKRLPPELRSRALSYGLIGAFVFRIIAIATASFLLQWTFVKLLGGGYLIFIALKHLIFESGEDKDQYTLDENGKPHLVDSETGEELHSDRANIEVEQRVPLGNSLVAYKGDETKSAGKPPKAFSAAAFWKMVLIIELTDIAFAVDSILAAMALAGSEEEKLWVVILGGLMGVVLMRFAAVMFIRLLERFPRFELSAYLLVAVIGLKLVLDWGCNSDWSFESTPRIATAMGDWHEGFQEFDAKRRNVAGAYDQWLDDKWPLGVAPKHHKIDQQHHRFHILDFHDLRRPESLLFWATMLGCFAVGFVPPKQRKKPAT